MSQELQAELNKTSEKIKLVQDFIALSLRRDKIVPQVEQIQKVCKQTLQRVQEIQADFATNEAQIVQEYETTMRAMQQKHQLILTHLLSQQQRLLQEAQNKKQSQQLQVPVLLSPKRPNNVLPKTFSSRCKALEKELFISVTPRMSVKDYMQSPLVQRKILKPIPIVFNDFEVEINETDFQAMPSYMRGRESVDQLRQFLNEIIVPCFNEKYQLIYRQRSTLNPMDVDVWKMYNDQAEMLPGRSFITPGDISRKIDKKIDKKMYNRITMLRHLGILKEQRIKQTICYIWNVNKNVN